MLKLKHHLHCNLRCHCSKSVYADSFKIADPTNSYHYWLRSASAAISSVLSLCCHWKSLRITCHCMSHCSEQIAECYDTAPQFHLANPVFTAVRHNSTASLQITSSCAVGTSVIKVSLSCQEHCPGTGHSALPSTCTATLQGWVSEAVGAGLLQLPHMPSPAEHAQLAMMAEAKLNQASIGSDFLGPRLLPGHPEQHRCVWHFINKHTVINGNLWMSYQISLQKKIIY